MDDEHLRDEVLEHYLLGILPEDRLPAIEEHLLFCPTCIARAESMDGFITLMRKALERKPN